MIAEPRQGPKVRILDGVRTPLIGGRIHGQLVARMARIAGGQIPDAGDVLDPRMELLIEGMKELEVSELSFGLDIAELLEPGAEIDIDAAGFLEHHPASRRRHRKASRRDSRGCCRQSWPSTCREGDTESLVTDRTCPRRTGSASQYTNLARLTVLSGASFEREWIDVGLVGVVQAREHRRGIQLHEQPIGTCPRCCISWMMTPMSEVAFGVGAPTRSAYSGLIENAAVEVLEHQVLLDLGGFLEKPYEFEIGVGEIPLYRGKPVSLGESLARGP